MPSKLFRTLAASGFALATVSAFAGQVTLFGDQGFQGQVGSANIAVPDLTVSTFGAGASSLIVTDGTWEACTDIYFRGRCAALTPGNYSVLSTNLSGRVLSVRPIGPATAAAPIVVTPVAVAPSAAAVVVNPAPTAVVVNPAPTAVVVNPSPAAVVVPSQAIIPYEVIVPAQIGGAYQRYGVADPKCQKFSGFALQQCVQGADRGD